MPIVPTIQSVPTVPSVEPKPSAYTWHTSHILTLCGTRSASFHPSIQEAHPRSLTDLEELRSPRQPFSAVPRPTRRYLKKLALSYLCCPDCESRNITYFGKSDSGTQKHRCKECGYQFVAQFDAYFPRSRRRDIFEREFMDNLSATGFSGGTGKRKYWKGARLETLQMTESQAIRVKFNRLLKEMPIQGERDYQLLVELVVHEAYGRVTG